MSVARGCRAGGVPVSDRLRLSASVETAWMLNAQCRASDPELFFPVSEVGPAARQVAAAKVVCAGCPVRSECLAFALDQHLQGVWGGTTESERRVRRAGRRVA